MGRLIWNLFSFNSINIGLLRWRGLNFMSQSIFLKYYGSLKARCIIIKLYYWHWKVFRTYKAVL